MEHTIVSNAVVSLYLCLYIYIICACVSVSASASVAWQTQKPNSQTILALKLSASVFLPMCMGVRIERAVRSWPID